MPSVAHFVGLRNWGCSRTAEDMTQPSHSGVQPTTEAWGSHSGVHHTGAKTLVRASEGCLPSERESFLTLGVSIV